MVGTCSWVTSTMRRLEKHWMNRDGCIRLTLVDATTKDLSISLVTSKVHFVIVKST